jgi:DNA-binding CsgD family transcriptional regulator
MFGIDQNKVSNHVRESFSKMKSSSQGNLHAERQKTPQKEEEK